MKLPDLRRAVCDVNRALLQMGLVTMHSGNASGLDAGARHLVIKPSGVDYLTLQPEDLVVVDVDTGNVVEGCLRPSVDLPIHLGLYRRLPALGGIVHTHSNYATAFAACRQPIPVVLTAIADEFGTEIPCAPFSECESDVSQDICRHRTSAPAILLANHGVFAWGPTPRDALKAAVMTEDVAKTVHFAMQIGSPEVLPHESARKYYERYHSRYGQSSLNEPASEWSASP